MTRNLSHKQLIGTSLCFQVIIQKGVFVCLTPRHSPPFSAILPVLAPR
jgi:hypothetical protein